MNKSERDEKVGSDGFLYDLKEQVSLIKRDVNFISDWINDNKNFRENLQSDFDKLYAPKYLERVVWFLIGLFVASVAFVLRLLQDLVVL